MKVSSGAVAFLVALLALAISAFAWMGQRSAARRAIPRDAVVSLGSFERGGLLRMEVALELDVPRVGELRAVIGARHQALWSIVNLEIVQPRPDADYARGRQIVETLKLQIRDRLNRELGAGAIVNVVVPRGTE